MTKPKRAFTPVCSRGKAVSHKDSKHRMLTKKTDQLGAAAWQTTDATN